MNANTQLFLGTLTIALCLATGAGGCTSSSASAEDVALRYVKSWPSAEALLDLCAADRSGTIAQERASGASNITRTGQKVTKVRVLRTKQVDTAQIVSVESTEPDIGKLMATFGEGNDLEELKNFERNIINAIKEGSYAKRVWTGDVRMVREEGAWKACPNFKDQQQERITKMIFSEAKRLGLNVKSTPFKELQHSVCADARTQWSSTPKVRAVQAKAYESLMGCPFVEGPQAKPAKTGEPAPR